jgi:curved DNA-binding protein CbpA
MGANFSLAVGHIPESHIRIYKNLIQLQSPVTRLQMLETLLAGQEYVASAKQTGFYGPILAYMAAVRRGDSATLPGEKSPTYGSGAGQGARPPESRLATGRGDTSSDKKAISFFSQCLQVLGLEEEIALNEQVLKTAYKKASIKAHPDKDGSEEEFDRVTRSYAFLGEILRRVRGGRNEMVNVSEESPARLAGAREQTSEAWKLKGEPVKLNPKNLNMETFNKVFDETKMPDPDGDGYGDWLKGQDEQTSSVNKFSGKFNRSVFNDAFESEIRSRQAQGRSNTGAIQNRQPEALTMAPHLGIELGRDRPEDFTGANLNGLKFTDLKKAYTTDSTFSHQVSDVRVSNRSFDAAATERKSAPQPLSAHEMEAIAEADRQLAYRQQQQAKRISQEDQRITEHFQRMQRYVITNQ